MDIIGYFASVFIGIFLGLIGGGGSILTVPVLVYLFHVDTILATTYSLFIVGVTSVVGSSGYFKNGFVDKQTVIAFGLPSVVIIFLTRTFVIPAIPNTIFTLGNWIVAKGDLLLVLFALLMVSAAYSMIKKAKVRESQVNIKISYSSLILQGVLVGFVTGLIGAGGGFLIIPALVNFVKLPIKKAIGTSLVIVAINSLSGFAFSIHHTAINWVFLLSIVLFAILGIFIGMAFSKRINAARLKPIFGWFILIMGTYILIKEIIH